MKRELWLQSLSKDHCPAWPCPICGKGTIALAAKSLIHRETVESKKARGHEAWDPDWIRYVFSAWAECTHPSCKQKFSLIGSGSVGPEWDDMGNENWEDYFLPKCCYPMPHIISLPNKCPEQVADELKASFSVYWLSRESCAGRIRSALEKLMNYVGVPKKEKGQARQVL
jgi:hypothetical protein